MKNASIKRIFALNFLKINKIAINLVQSDTITSKASPTLSFYNDGYIEGLIGKFNKARSLDLRISEIYLFFLTF